MTCAAEIGVFRSLDAVSPPFSHCEPSVFPDDTSWYSLFETHVADQNSNILVFQAKSKDQRATVVFPLVQLRSPFGRVTLASMENYYSVDFRPLCSTPGARLLIESILAQITRTAATDILRLQPLDIDAPETEISEQALRKLGWRVYRSLSHVNWVHDFEGNFDDYMSQRPGRLRSTLRRKSAKLMALGDVEITIHDGQIGINKLIDAYQIIYARSWKVPEPHDRFIPELIAKIAQMGQLRLGLLKIGNRPIAAHFWIVKHGYAYIYKLAHDREFDRYSPGTVLMAKMVQYVLENDEVTRLDFLTGDDGYKRDWMTERRRKLTITAYNPRSLHGIVAHFMDQQCRPVVNRLTIRFKNNPLTAAIADRIFLRKRPPLICPTRASAVSKPVP